MWVRGLKLKTLGDYLGIFQSHPMWVRGLKHTHIRISGLNINVAPHVGAWIETNSGIDVISLSSRTPCGCVD